ncbi:MAG: DNA primase [Clostridia bacterium]|jgi:DNA primase|nr:DNA primase [Clostridia bacterium]
MREGEYAEFLKTLKTKCDLVEVISSYVKVERRGANYWACCPFHHEKTPSFSINAPDRYYHCFGCGASGDVIRFVQEYENVEFPQAVEILAKRAGLEVPANDDRSGERTAELKRKKDNYLKIMRLSARFYLNNLYSGKAEKYLEYLSGRKLSPSTVKKFGLGASFDFTSLPSFLLDNGFSPQDIVDSGACIRSEEGRILDAEGGRLIFPIINHMDEVIAFGGRVMVKTDRAKYKNTRETMIFNKSKNLYNVNLVKKLKRAGGISSVIMVEGYMDAISMYQAGFQNVVASMGTSLTKEQARLCKRYSDNVFISYDGDFAGQKANLRGLDILKEEGLRVRVVPMPEGLDPDDVVKKFGADGYRDCLEKAMPLIDFRILAAQRKYDFSKSDERRDFVKEALAIVREAESATEREQLLKRISSLADVSYSALMRDFENAPAPKAESTPAPPVREENADREKKAARFVLAACLLNREYAKTCDPTELQFDDEEHRKIAAYIEEGRKEGRVRPSGLFDLMDADGELAEVLNLDYGDNLDGEKAERFFADSVNTLRRKKLLEEQSRLNAAYNQETSREKRLEIAARIGELIKKLKNVR